MTPYLYMIPSCGLDRFSSWHMLLVRYLQTFVSVLVLVDVAIKLSKDIYKTKILQKNRKGLLKLNWIIPMRMCKKAHAAFDKYSMFLSGFGINQNTIWRGQIETLLRWSKKCIRLQLGNILSLSREDEKAGT